MLWLQDPQFGFKTFSMDCWARGFQAASPSQGCAMPAAKSKINMDPGVQDSASGNLAAAQPAVLVESGIEPGGCSYSLCEALCLPRAHLV